MQSRLQTSCRYDRLAPGDIMKKKLRGSIFLLLTTIIWGSAFISQRVGMGHIGPFTFQAVRCFLAVIGLLPIIAVSDHFSYKKERKSSFSRWCDPRLWKIGLICGIPLALATNLQQIGLIEASAGKAAFLTSMYIVIVPLLSLFFKKQMAITTLISIAVAVAGLYCLSCIGEARFLLSDLVLLASSLMFAVQIVFIDHFAKDIDPLRLNVIQALICAVLSAICMLFTESPRWDEIIICGLPLAHAGFLSMGCAYALQIIGQKDVEPTAASLIMSLESVFATILGFLLLNETMTKWEVIGCGLVFAAVITSQIPAKNLIRQKNASL